MFLRHSQGHKDKGETEDTRLNDSFGTWVFKGPQKIPWGKQKNIPKLCSFQMCMVSCKQPFLYLSRFFKRNQLMTRAIPPTIPYCIPGGRSSRHRLCRCGGPSEAIFDGPMFEFSGSWWLMFCNSSHCFGGQTSGLTLEAIHESTASHH